MHASKSILIGTIFLLAAFCVDQVEAQKSIIDKEELLEEYKSSKGYKQLQAEMGDLAPSVDVEISFELYRKTDSGRKEVTDAVNKSFLIIEQYPCGAYGANPKTSHFENALGTYQLKTNIWDPQCISVNLTADALSFSKRVEWNPESFSSGNSEVERKKTIPLSNDYMLKVTSTWTQNNPSREIKIPTTKTGSLSATLAHIIPPSSQENKQTTKPLPNTEISIPELDRTVVTDPNGSFEIRDIPAQKPLKLIAKSTHSGTPDTLTVVVRPDTTINMGNVIIN